MTLMAPAAVIARYFDISGTSDSLVLKIILVVINNE